MASQYRTDVKAQRRRVDIHSLIDSVRDWLDSFLDLVVLEGKKAGIGLALMLGFGPDRS